MIWTILFWVLAVACIIIGTLTLWTFTKGGADENTIKEILRNDVTGRYDKLTDLFNTDDLVLICKRFGYGLGIVGILILLILVLI